MRYGVWCAVSGGVTGNRQAWLKDIDGEMITFPNEEAARDEAARLEKRTNGPFARASFSYTAREVSA